ncbi:hypothetical protein Dimus_025292 [Dionaea muscipula]
MSKTTTLVISALTVILMVSGLASAARPLTVKDVMNTTPQQILPPPYGSGIGFNVGWGYGWPLGGHIGVGVGPYPGDTGLDIGWASGWPWGGHISFGSPNYPYGYPFPFPVPVYSDPNQPCPWCAPFGRGGSGEITTPAAAESPKP